MKIAVLGGGGFIGSNMLKFLKEKGHFVRAVDKSFRPERSELYRYADEVVSLDLREYKSAFLAVEGMDYVIHLAASMGGVGFFHNHNYHPFLDNMQIDINVLKACELMKVERMFYASSACAYPIHLQMEEGKPPKLREDQLIPANSDQTYGWEKFMITHLSTEAPFDLRVGIQHTIFGPYQEIEGERMKFPTAIATKILAAKSMEKPLVEIWGNGQQIRSFLYIDDAVEKIYEVLTKKDYFGPVNIGSEEAYNVDEIASMCASITGLHNVTFAHTLDKPSGVLARNCDNTKWNKHYKYRNKFSTKEGFTKLLAWLQKKDLS